MERFEIIETTFEAYPTSNKSVCDISVAIDQIVKNNTNNKQSSFQIIELNDLQFYST